MDRRGGQSISVQYASRAIRHLSSEHRTAIEGLASIDTVSDISKILAYNRGGVWGGIDIDNVFLVNKNLRAAVVAAVPLLSVAIGLSAHARISIAAKISRILR